MASPQTKKKLTVDTPRTRPQDEPNSGSNTPNRRTKSGETTPRSPKEGNGAAERTPKTTNRKVLEEVLVDGGTEISLSRMFEQKGVAVVQHKFRKVLMGGVGSKPRLLTLTKDSSKVNLVKRNATPLAPGDEGDEDNDYSADLGSIVRVISGAETLPLKRSVRKREKTTNGYLAACDRCLTICFVDRNWDIEIDISADVDGNPLTQASANAIRDGVVEFLIKTSAISTLSVSGNSPPSSTPKAAAAAGKKTASSSKRNKGTFRQRRLSTHQSEDMKEMVDDIVADQESELYMAKEMSGDLSTDMDLPFPPDQVGTFSCHGIEPKMSISGVTVDAKINQDRGGIQYPFAGRRDMAFFCVMDGHGRGGEKISSHCMQTLPTELANHPDLNTNPSKALRDSFIKADRSLRAKLRREAMYAGTTCIAVLAVKDEFFVANAGDSRAVLGTISNGKVTSVDLSEDQKPDTPSEQERIERMGGYVTPSSALQGPSRVWLNSSLASCGLAMSRSLGDHALATVGCISEPEVTIHQSGPNDRYLILASDGVWEFVSSEEACDLVHKHIGEGADRACMRLIEAASVEWKKNEGEYRDDITGIVAVLPVFQTEGTAL